MCLKKKTDILLLSLPKTFNRIDIKSETLVYGFFFGKGRKKKTKHIHMFGTTNLIEQKVEGTWVNVEEES